MDKSEIKDRIKFHSGELVKTNHIPRDKEEAEAIYASFHDSGNALRCYYQLMNSGFFCVLAEAGDYRDSDTYLSVYPCYRPYVFRCTGRY